MAIIRTLARRLVAAGCLVVAVPAGATGQPSTIVTLDWKKPLAEQLPPGSREVVVRLRSAPPLVLTPSTRLGFTREFQIARDFSAAVVYGELTSVESYVVERPSWIATRVKIRVQDVPFMRRGVRAPLSDEVSVVYQGGKLFIGDVLVRTDGAISLSAGQRCLMFLSAPASNSQDWGLAQFYGILTDETLVDGYGNTVLEPPDDKALTLERLVGILKGRR